MSRPTPTILTQHIDCYGFKTEQVLRADAVYAVYYLGTPINLRTINEELSSPIKYKKCNFSNVGHAKQLAKRLNKLFKTTEFVVYKLDAGTLVS